MGSSQSSEAPPDARAAAASSASAAPARSGLPKVVLNVYSPSGGQHAIYHSGVEVLGAEYVFGGGDTSFSGVTAQQPRVPPPGSGWVFYQAVDIGSSRLSREETLRAVQELRGSFPGNSYDLAARNCNHFSDALCQRLVGQGIPSWVNRLAGIGNSLRGVVGAEAAPAAGQADGGTGGPAAAGLVAKTVGADGDLSPHVEWTGVGVLNAADGAPEALRQGTLVASEDDPELLLQLPFQSPVKLQSVKLVAPDAARAPQRVRLFANQRDIDMGDASGGVAPTQAFERLQWSAAGADGSVAASVDVKFLKFQNLAFLCVYLAGEDGADEGTVALQGFRLHGTV